ncbi:SRPBCC family protein [Roseobacter sp.]|uniref:SRPBCC family protein n=1 Tax=Roseobacter sp. TaxID=1907202 RepID=UPI00329A0F87
MKLSTQEIIKLPIAVAFDALSDFTQLERAARRRDAVVRRVGDVRTPGVGMAWKATFEVGGRRRDVELVVVEYTPGERLVVDFVSQGLYGTTRMDLVALSRDRTRVIVGLEMRASTLVARLLLQSLKLAKPRINSTYKDRIAQHLRIAQRQYRNLR